MMEKMTAKTPLPVPVVSDSTEVSDKANEVAQFLLANPETFRLLIHATRKDPDSRFLASYICHRDIVCLYCSIVALFGGVNIEFPKVILSDSKSDSTKDQTFPINHPKQGLPARNPVRFTWPLRQGIPSATTASSTSDTPISLYGKRHDADEDEDYTPDFTYRLAVTKDLELTCQPSLFWKSQISSDSVATPWSHGTLYSVHYAEEATATEHEQLAQLHISLPGVVLDLGRLFVSKDVGDRSDGRIWSPSAFSAMVDINSKAVWLICDRKIANSPSTLHGHDGLADELAAVNSYFDPKDMDLALFFPNIDDWASSKVSWLVFESHIRQSAMKLGLSLRHL